MLPGVTVLQLAAWAMMLCLGAFSPEICFAADRKVPAAEMPAHWQVISDFQVPAEQVKNMSGNLGADLDSIRNTIYDVNGKRVQVNVIVVPDVESADKLMVKLRSLKAEEALLQKGLIVYEFVGRNEVLPVIAEGRKHLASM